MLGKGMFYTKHYTLMRCCTFKSGNSSCSLLHPLLCSMTLYNIAFIKHDTNERNNQLQVKSHSLLFFMNLHENVLMLRFVVNVKHSGAVSHLSSRRCSSAHCVYRLLAIREVENRQLA